MEYPIVSDDLELADAPIDYGESCVVRQAGLTEDQQLGLYPKVLTSVGHKMQGHDRVCDGRWAACGSRRHVCWCSAHQNRLTARAAQRREGPGSQIARIVPGGKQRRKAARVVVTNFQIQL